MGPYEQQKIKSFENFIEDKDIVNFIEFSRKFE